MTIEEARRAAIKHAERIGGTWDARYERSTLVGWSVFKGRRRVKIYKRKQMKPEVEIRKDGTVVVYTQGATVTIDANKKNGYLVAVNKDTPGHRTETIR